MKDRYETFSTPHIHLRRVRENDFAAISALNRAHDIKFLGTSNNSEELLREDWRPLAHYDPREWSAIAETADGEIIGLAQVMVAQEVPVHPYLWIVTHPDWTEAVAPQLIQWSISTAEDARDRVPDHARISVQAGVHHDNVAMAEQYRAHGFITERCFYSMLIRFEGVTPPQPVMPDGLRLVTFDEYPNLEAFAHAMRDGFADHRGSTASTIEHHIGRIRNDTEDSNFDPTLWWLALDADNTPAGVCRSWSVSEDFPNVAYVAQLAVVPQYRQRGLAAAMLHACFGEYFRRGFEGVTLGVDGSSLTNAVALYKRVGMHIAAQWDSYELETRAGEEISRQ